MAAASKGVCLYFRCRLRVLRSADEKVWCVSKTLLSIALFAVASLCEIGGCFAIWGWMKLDRPIWWVGMGGLSLLVFGFLLSFSPSDFAGRAFAAYGGVYIAASLGWMMWVEGRSPSSADLLGAAIAIVGALVILLGNR